MAGKNVILKRNARINGKLIKAGEKAQVSKEIEAELLDAGAIQLDYEAEAIAKIEAEEAAAKAEAEAGKK
jgi:hypothetical protein